MIKLLLKKGVIPLLLLFISCNSADSNLIPVSSDEVEFQVEWRVPVNADSNQKMIIDNRIIYFAERNSGGAIALDVETGDEIWRDKEVDYYISNPLIFENGSVGYISRSNSWTLYLYSSKGDLLKSINCPEDKFMLQGFAALADKNKIYWNSYGYGLTSLDIEEDIEYDPETGKWIGQPELIYKWSENGDENGVRYTVPSIYNNTLYSGYHNRGTEPGLFFAVDLNDNKILWESRSGSLYAYSGNSIQFRKGKLAVLDTLGYGIINPENGEFEVSISGLDKPYGNGVWFYDDKVYFTNENSSTFNISNIFCLDEDTGKTIWELSRPYSHGSNPVCYKGIMYIAMQNSIDLFNTETGEYLGSDTSLRGDEWQICNVLQYEDTLIFRNLEEVIAVKMNFRLNKDGLLCQS